MNPSPHKRHSHHNLQLKLLAVLLILTSAMTARAALNVALITGSTRKSGPPIVLHPRVTTFIQTALTNRGHNVTTINPGDFALLDKPYFGYRQGEAPEKLQEAQQTLSTSHCYVCITPEYNHSPSPALLNVLNHFGSSTFSFKPSAIVTYSAGQWGGTRAAVMLRSTLSELGCLPVSAMIHIPKAQEVLDRDGTVFDSQDPGGWEKYCARCFSQMEWWAEGAMRQRELMDPFEESPGFVKNPSQRNAP
eukprot:scaffold19382_cov32-Cyclotella_meneghiniana.AAC.2